MKIPNLLVAPRKRLEILSVFFSHVKYPNRNEKNDITSQLSKYEKAHLWVIQFRDFWFSRLKSSFCWKRHQSVLHSQMEQLHISKKQCAPN